MHRNTHVGIRLALVALGTLMVAVACNNPAGGGGVILLPER